MYQLAQAYLVSYNCNKNASRIFFFFKNSTKDKASFLQLSRGTEVRK